MLTLNVLNTIQLNIKSKLITIEQDNWTLIPVLKRNPYISKKII